ncbi:MAG: short-chain dehydrogenase [Desulfurococcales archaeon ex4484_217_2]|nr:MAG: short-chain dehydrogenase [Desulfurococcales archaeon ex4484_217_2]
MKLKNKVAIITGAAKGIGRAIAIEFVKEGAKVVVADIDFEGAKRTVEDIKKLGGEAIAVKVNVADPNDVEVMVKKTLDAFGKIDILINNAGIAIQKPALEMTLDEWKKIIDVNLTGVFLCSQAVGRVMVKQGGGVIINMASMLGFIAIPKRSAYCASKAGVIGLTKELAVEWAKYGIRVVGVAPGWVATKRVIELTKKGVVNEEVVKTLTPMGRMATPEEVAKLMVFLASDDASFITGETVLIDGGYVAYGGPV